MFSCCEPPRESARGSRADQRNLVQILRNLSASRLRRMADFLGVILAVHAKAQRKCRDGLGGGFGGAEVAEGGLVETGKARELVQIGAFEALVKFCADALTDARIG